MGGRTPDRRNVTPVPPDIIVAQATPAGTGALAIVRVSGAGAIVLVGDLFQGRRPLAQTRSHRVRHGRFGAGGETVDDVMAAVFRPPMSYTGEEMVEITCHGNPLLVRQILELLLRQGSSIGARVAEPGEFTRRAFQNGRLDLAQAEAVADLISASAQQALRGARGQLDGYLSGRVTRLREVLLECRSLLELELDFVEQDLPVTEHQGTAARLAEISTAIRELAGAVERGRAARHGVRVAIVGAPNVGKSSLLNALTEDSRAIVTDVPGTTRDVIRVEVALEGLVFQLSDTAGIRETHDEIEREGMRRTWRAAAAADLVLHVVDVRNGVDPPIPEQLRQPGASPVLTVFNKADLLPVGHPSGTPLVSAFTGAGMVELVAAVCARVAEVPSDQAVPLVANLRHQEALQRAGGAIARAEQTHAEGGGGELVSADLQEAEQHLAEVVGEITSDDLLERIFARFCIGK